MQGRSRSARQGSPLPGAWASRTTPGTAGSKLCLPNPEISLPNSEKHLKTTVSGRIASGTGFDTQVLEPAMKAHPFARNQNAQGRHAMTRQKTILVILPHTNTRRNVSQYLLHMGYAVVETSWGREALSYCSQPEPGIDLVITSEDSYETDCNDLMNQLALLIPRARRIVIESEEPQVLLEIPRDCNWLQSDFSGYQLTRAVVSLIGAPLTALSGHTRLEKDPEWAHCRILYGE